MLRVIHFICELPSLG